MKRYVHVQSNDGAPVEGPFDFHGYTVWHQEGVHPFNAGLVEIESKILPIPVCFLRFLPVEEHNRVVIAR